MVIPPQVKYIKFIIIEHFYLEKSMHVAFEKTQNNFLKKNQMKLMKVLNI